MATDKATTPTADERDIPAEVAELRTAITNLIDDRESLQADNAELVSRVEALENRPIASGEAGVPVAAIEREFGKLRRPLKEIRDQNFFRVPMEDAEPLVPVAPEPAGTVGDGGASVGATSQAGSV
jgi:hypothetical protein